ncbi:MAG TPA: hypothetical protein VFO19_01160 [Vicinamibacterales bacterium]|jgi:hypothetical protein|nr:hypothetical protein [Vicinamibacterales bacterium]
MNANLDHTTSARSATVECLHWIFVRAGRALACTVAVCGSNSCSVHVQPLWTGAAEAIETFTRPLDALRRHAEIVGLLRQQGWLLADRAGTREA